MPETGVKYDGEKPELYLLPPRALNEVGKVLTVGARKYSPNNWKQLDQLQERYTSAALRHIFAHMQGERLDPETGLDHLAHAMCCLLFKLEKTLINEEESKPTELTIDSKAWPNSLLSNLLEDWGYNGNQKERPRETDGHEHRSSDIPVGGRFSDY